MKTAQWIVLLGVVVAMVFGITFAVSSLPGRKSSGPKSAPQAKLTFADSVTRFPAPEPGKPEVEQPPAECELGHSQAHDFWFKNENAQDLPVGVFSKTCQCTTVELWIAPKDWTDVPEPAQRDEAVKKLEASVQPTQLLEKQNGAAVPAGAVGFVRLTWKGDKAGPKSLSATLWMDEAGPGPTQIFRHLDRLCRPGAGRRGERRRRFRPGRAAPDGLHPVLVLDAAGVRGGSPAAAAAGGRAGPTRSRSARRKR